MTLRGLTQALGRGQAGERSLHIHLQAHATAGIRRCRSAQQLRPRLGDAALREQGLAAPASRNGLESCSPFGSATASSSSAYARQRLVSPAANAISASPTIR